MDRSGRAQLPLGCETFEDHLREFIFVDKSLAMRELMNRRGTTILCRPPRFGKSTFVRMLQCFFETPFKGYVSDRRSLFDGLAIAADEARYLDQCGTHPVISLRLGDCGGETFEHARDLIAQKMGAEYSRHRYLMDEGTLRGGEVARFRRLAEGNARPVELESSLGWLSMLLARHHRAQTVILIDDYDVPMTCAHLGGYPEQMLDFLRPWLTDALKDTVDLYCGVLTGVVRLILDTPSGGLDNAQIDTTLDDELAQAIGFTDTEVEEMAAYLGCPDKLGEMAALCGGYRFGETDIYSPWSVLNFLYTGIAEPCLTTTDRKKLVTVTDLVRHANASQTVELSTLAGGGLLIRPLDLRRTLDDTTRYPEAMWAGLYQAGYVTTDDTGHPNDDEMPRRLRIPNLEVGKLFGKELLGRATSLAGSKKRLQALHRAIIAADAKETQEALRKILFDSASYYDLNDEGDYHVLLLALLYAVDGYRPATSNRETGDGRCDVLLEPLPAEADHLRAHAMEIKLYKSPQGCETLDEHARNEALGQAERLAYGHGLAGAGLVQWDFAFSGKHVAVVNTSDS